MAVIRGFAIAVRSAGAYIFAVLHGLPLLCLDFSSDVQCVSLVYHVFQRKHNASMQVIQVSRIELIRNGDKPDIVRRKIPLDIVAGIDEVPPQPRQVLYDHTVDMSRLNIGKHLLKSRPPEGDPGKAVVDIGVIDPELRLICEIIIQYEPLVFNGIAALFVILD